MVCVKRPLNKLRCEDNLRKLEVHTMKKNFLAECTDEEICDRSIFIDDEIRKIVDGKRILKFVGKLL